MSMKVLLIGLGQIGMGYDLNHIDNMSKIYTHARAFHLHSDFLLIAAVDTDKQRCEKFENTYQSPAYETLEHALSIHIPDLVVVALPTEHHYKTMCQVLKLSKPKAILCEKPLSYSLSEAVMMVDLCKSRNINLYVNYMRRSDPGVIEIKRRIDDGEIKIPVKGNNWYSKGIRHNGGHFFNLLEYWLGPLSNTQVIDKGRLWNERDPEPDLRLVFSKGSVLMLAAWEEKFSHYDIELLAANGRLRYEQGGKVIHWQRLEGDRNFDGYTRLGLDPRGIFSGMERYQWHVAEQLSLALKGDKFQLCSGDEALTTQKNIQTIIETISYD